MDDMKPARFNVKDILTSLSYIRFNLLCLANRKLAGPIYHLVG